MGRHIIKRRIQYSKWRSISLMAICSSPIELNALMRLLTSFLLFTAFSSYEPNLSIKDVAELQLFQND